MFFLVSFVFPYQPGSLYVVDGLPGVIAFGVALPLYEILQLSFLPMTSVAPDGLDLVLFSVVDKVRWGSRIIFPVFFCLYIGGKEGAWKTGCIVHWGGRCSQYATGEMTSSIRKGLCLLGANLTDLYGSDKF